MRSRPRFEWLRRIIDGFSPVPIFFFFLIGPFEIPTRTKNVLHAPVALELDLLSFSLLRPLLPLRFDASTALEFSLDLQHPL